MDGDDKGWMEKIENGWKRLRMDGWCIELVENGWTCEGWMEMMKDG